MTCHCAGVKRYRPSLPARMMAQSEGAGSDDVDCIRDYVCSLGPRLAGGRPLSADRASDHAYSTTTAALKYDARVEIPEIFDDDNLVERHNDNPAFNR